ncbi:hypothetical protein DPMN_149235 [Dreissena polymorpha]|uniref:Uncharacterized protein n=1 Tax=Dreissena polymorpha TaxID=45954 RepID=A0A9D4J4I9_DREPO|nr:hypothetical protein DPMN_149235 [Dreissena polymorpha]
MQEGMHDDKMAGRHEVKYVDRKAGSDEGRHIDNKEGARRRNKKEVNRANRQ